MTFTHSHRLERWLGAQAVEDLSRSMRDWYGPKIPVHGVPGEIYAHAGGDFTGYCEAGQFASVFDRGCDLARRLQRRARIATGDRRAVLHAGFATLGDLLLAARGSAGSRQDFTFASGGITAGAAGGNVSYWGSGTPAGGTAGSAAPAGRVPVGGTNGGFVFNNAPTGMRTFFAGGSVQTNDAVGTQGGQIMIYDRLFDVAKTMSSTVTEAVTGLPTRYTNTTRLAADDIAGNFCFIEVQSNLGAVAHNWTVCQYTDQDNAASTFPSMAGNSGQPAGRFDHPTYTWFFPPAAGDIGVKAITQMQCDASVSGSANFVVAHPIAWMPVPYGGMMCDIGGIISGFNFARVFDGACMSWLSICQPSSAARTHSGTFTLVAG